MREGPWMANPGSLAVSQREWGHIGIPPSQGAVAPQTQLGGPDPWGRTVAKRAAFTPRCPPSKVGLSRGTCCPLTLSVLGMPTASSGATGEDATKPAAPWDSRGTRHYAPDRGWGALRPPLPQSGVPGRQGSRPASTGGPGTSVKGPMAPHTHGARTLKGG